MDNNIRISKEEREKITKGEVEEFPKYTTQLLNLANRNAQSTRQNVVGNMNELLKEFGDRYPNGTYEDWKEFYLKEQNGEERLEESTQKLFEMILRMKEAMKEIDEEMARRFVNDLVLYRTYMGEDVEEVVFQKLSGLYGLDYEPPSTNDKADGYLGDQPVRIVSFKDKPDKSDNKKIDNIPTVYYHINKHDQSIEVDTHQLSRELGVVVTEEGTHKRLDNY